MTSSAAKNNAIVDQLLEFLDASPTPFHATQSLASILSHAGFSELSETEQWQLSPGKYFFTRGGSSIVGFIVGTKPMIETGIHIVGAHTDSPCLKVKPTPEKLTKGYDQLGIEVYGGALLNPWFDRDLALAGKVNYIDRSGNLCSTLVNISEPIAFVPSLAIHLDRSANKDRSVNPQTDMNPILNINAVDATAEKDGAEGDKETSGNSFALKQLLLSRINQDLPEDDFAKEILEFNLSFYDTQNAKIIGLNNDFLASARLDNLLSCFVAVKALVNANEEQSSLVICNDHEEVGSCSTVGAAGNLLELLVDRLLPEVGYKQVTLAKSLMISADNAHGVHPNYVTKHDEKHGPLLNHGPVLKFDANQSYATSSDSSAKLRWLAKTADIEIPLQTYVTRADMRCGSTIGPMTAAKLGIDTADVGVPTFAMHSIRETAGVKDIIYLYKFLARFYSFSR